MKTDFLKGLTFKVGENDISLPDEIVTKILAENGKDIESTKTKLNGQIEKLESENKSKDEMLANVNSEIEKYKGMDIENIKKSATEWEEKYKNFETQSKADKEAYEQKLKDQEYDFKVKEFVNSQKFTSDFVKKAFENEFKAQGFKVGEDGNFMGANDYMKSFGEKNQGVFVVEKAQKEENSTPGVETFTAPTGGGVTGKKMSLMDKMKLKNSNPNATISFEQ